MSQPPVVLFCLLFSHLLVLPLLHGDIIVQELKSSYNQVSVLFQSAKDPFSSAAETDIRSISGIAISPATGQVYYADADKSQIFKFADNDEVVLVAGTGEVGYADGDSMIAKFSYMIQGLAFNSNGSLLAIADASNHVIRLMNVANGWISTLAGTAGVTGNKDDDVGSKSTFNYPCGLTFDSRGNLLVADYGNNLIRKIEISSGRVSTIAGNGIEGWNGDQGSARSISLNRPTDIVLDPIDNSFYFTDALNHAVRRVNATGHLATVIRNETLMFFPWGIGMVEGSLFVTDLFSYYLVKIGLDSATREAAVYAGSQDTFQGSFDGSLKESQFQGPKFLALDPFNSSFLLVSDFFAIRSINFKSKFLSTVLRSSGFGIFDGVSVQARFNNPRSMSFDKKNQIIYVSDSSNHAIRRILINSNYKVDTVVGQGQAGYLDGSFTMALINFPYGILVDPDDFRKVYVCDYKNHAIRILDMTAKNVSTLTARLFFPKAIVKAQSGGFYVVTENHEIDFLNEQGQFTRIAGGSFACNDGYGVSGSFASPHELISDLNGTLFISSRFCHQIKKIASDSFNIEAIAGTELKFGLLDGYGTSAKFNSPAGLSLDHDALYIADSMNHAVRKLHLGSNNFVKTISGNGQMGYRNGISAVSLYNFPTNVLAVGNDSIYISDTFNNAIRLIQNGTVTTVAGYGSPIYKPELKSVKSLKSLKGIVCKSNNEVFVLDSTGNGILKMKLNNNGQMETFEALAGNGSPGWLDGVGVSSMFSNPSSIAQSQSGSHLLVADAGNHLIRRVDLATSAVTTVAGNGFPGNFISRNPMLASFNKPQGIAIDAASDVIYVSDSGNHCIKRINASNIVSLVAGSATGTFGFIDGSSKIARFYNPTSLTLDPVTRILFIADTYNHAIRSLGLDGRVNTVCGTKNSGFVDGFGSQARFNKPTMISLQRIGDSRVLLILDSGNTAIRVIATNQAGNATVSTWLNDEKASYQAIAICNNGNQILISEKGTLLSFARPQLASTTIQADSSKAGQLEMVMIAVFVGTFGLLALALYILYSRKKKYVQKTTTTSILQSIGQKSTNITAADQSSTVSSIATEAIAIPGYLQVDLDRSATINSNLQVIGTGGTAQVIKCKLKDPSLIQKHGIIDIVVKVFGKETSKESFLYEVMLMNSLPKSPNLIELIGYSQGRSFAIIMKDYPMNLKELVSNVSFPNSAEFNLKISVDIANGMNLIHQKGIIHFDLKPANVLIEFLNGSVNCVICDFGFANFLSDAQDKIVKGVKKPSAIGITARYAAPELFAKVNMRNLAPSLKSEAPVDIEKKIDVYAYAMTLFIVYAREAPWKDLPIDEIERLAVAGERPEIPSEINIPKKIEDLIKVCWSHDPNERPSFADILEILAQ